MTFRKYNLLPTDWEQFKPLVYNTVEIRGESHESINDLVQLIHVIGHTCEAWATSEDGKQVCSQMSATIGVDIVWSDKPHPDFDKYMIWPKDFIHSLGESYDNEYLNAMPK